MGGTYNVHCIWRPPIKSILFEDFCHVFSVTFNLNTMYMGFRDFGLHAFDGVSSINPDDTDHI